MAKTTRETLDSSIENNLGARLLKRFKAEDNKKIDLGFGDEIELKIPKTFSEYSSLLEQAKTRYAETGKTDDNFIYCYLLESVVTNLNEMEIQEIVFNCPGLTDILLKSLDAACGNVLTRVEAELIEESKKESKKTASSEPSSA